MCLLQESRWTLPAAMLCVIGGLVGQVSLHQTFYKYTYRVFILFLNYSAISHRRCSHVQLLFGFESVLFFITYGSVLMTNLSIWIINGYTL